MPLVDIFYLFNELNRSPPSSPVLFGDLEMENGTDMPYENVPSIPPYLSTVLNERPRFGPHRLANSRPFVPPVYEEASKRCMSADMRRRDIYTDMDIEMVSLKRQQEVDMLYLSQFDTEEDAQIVEGRISSQGVWELV